MTKHHTSKPLSENKHLLRWVEKMAELCKPDSLHWVDGSKEEYDELCKMMVASGTFIKLNEKLWPGCFYARSDPHDVARHRSSRCNILARQEPGPDRDARAGTQRSVL